MKLNIITLFLLTFFGAWFSNAGETSATKDQSASGKPGCPVITKHVMSIELTQPAGFPARFLESKDLLNWNLMPPECQHALGRYNAPHCLRWHNGWFYL